MTPGIIRRRSVTLHRPRKADPVTQAMRSTVLLRDRECVAAKLGFEHVCRDAFGWSHAPFALDRLTLEHVHEGYGMMGRRAPSDPRHLLALCAGLNLRPPTKEMRAAFRLYLERVG